MGLSIFDPCLTSNFCVQADPFALLTVVLSLSSVIPSQLSGIQGSINGLRLNVTSNTSFFQVVTPTVLSILFVNGIPCPSHTRSVALPLLDGASRKQVTAATPPGFLLQPIHLFTSASETCQALINVTVAAPLTPTTATMPSNIAALPPSATITLSTAPAVRLQSCTFLLQWLTTSNAIKWFSTIDCIQLPAYCAECTCGNGDGRHSLASQCNDQHHCKRPNLASASPSRTLQWDHHRHYRHELHPYNHHHDGVPLLHSIRSAFVTPSKMILAQTQRSDRSLVDADCLPSRRSRCCRACGIHRL